MPDPPPPSDYTGDASYDPDLEGYHGISAGSLDSVAEVRDARAFAEMIVDTVREGLLVLDLDLRVLAANESFYRMFGIAPSVTVGRLVYEIRGGEWDLPELRELLEGILPEEEAFDGYEVDQTFEGVGHRYMVLNARRLDAHDLILLAIEDATARRNAERDRDRSEQSLRQSEEREAFLLLLSDALRPVRDPIKVKYTAARLLGEHLGANRVGYAEDLGDGEHVFVARTYTDGLPGLEGVFRYDDYGGELLQAFHAGRTVVRPDIQGAPSLSTAEKAAHAALGVSATVNVPILKEGRLVGVFGVNQRGAREWTEEEVTLIESVAERTWEAVERAHAAAALRESEEQYKTLFEATHVGFCIVEVFFDGEGRGVDYRFLEANPAFERHTGLIDPAGKTVRELVPGLEDRWPETYGRIAATGEPEEFVMGSEVMGRWFNVGACRIGPPEAHRVAILFIDVTAQKDAEAKLRELNTTLETRVRERTRQVRELSRSLTLAEQQERERIARVIHDDLQQTLFGAKLHTELGHTDQAAAALSRAAHIARALSHDLSPLALSGDGIAELLEWVAARKRDLYGLEVAVEVDPEAKLASYDLRVLLSQILRELLLNVVKHAGTLQAQLTAGSCAGCVRVVVADGGEGFDADALAEAPSSGGLGLLNVRKRVELVGGQLEVESAPGAGTRVTIELPAESETAPDPV